MVLSVTELKARCLEVIRQVEGGKTAAISRHGKIVARLVPAGETAEGRPWERLRGSGRLLAAPGESVLTDEDFEALR